MHINIFWTSSYKEFKFLTKFEVRTSQLYGLPKIHKSESITTHCQQNKTTFLNIAEVDDLTLRPIIAGPSSLTHRLSKLLHVLLSPYLQFIPSYISDSRHFLSTLPTSIPPNSFLISFDIVSLYPSIEPNLGIEAVSYWLTSFPNTLNPRFSSSFIIYNIIYS